MKQRFLANSVHAIGCAAVISIGGCSAEASDAPQEETAQVAQADTANICVKLLETLTLPVTQTFVNCTWDTWACAASGQWQCCNGALCGLTPWCGATKTIVSTVQTIQAGDTYCNFSGEELFDRFLAGQIQLSSDMLLGGLPSTFYSALDASVEALRTQGSDLPNNTKAALKDLVKPVYQHGDVGYSYTDVDSVRVVKKSTGYASRYFTQDFAAVTVGGLIIMVDEDFDALFNGANHGTLAEIQGRADAAYIRAVNSLAHELVHQAQFRRVGADAFHTNYLLDMMVKGGVNEGYDRSVYEKEAYTFAAQIALAAGGPYCENNTAYHVGQINAKGLSVTWDRCRATDRVGVVLENQHLWVKEGGLEGTWVDEFNDVTQGVLSGYRIGTLDTSGHFRVKEGGLSSGWIDEWEPGGVVQGILAGNRIGVVLADGRFEVKQGGLSAGWTEEYDGAVVQGALSGDRIGMLLNDGHFWVKEGALSADWVDEWEDGGVVQGVLAGTRIGVLANGHFRVKEGGLGASWVDEWERGGVSQGALTTRRIGVLADGHFRVKEGGLGASWVDEWESGGVVRGVLSGDRIGVLLSNGDCWVKEGGLGARWVWEYDSLTGCELPNN